MWVSGSVIHGGNPFRLSSRTNLGFQLFPFSRSLTLENVGEKMRYICDMRPEHARALLGLDLLALNNLPFAVPRLKTYLVETPVLPEDESGIRERPVGIVTEFVEGQLLEEALKSGFVTLTELREMLVELLTKVQQHDFELVDPHPWDYRITADKVLIQTDPGSFLPTWYLRQLNEGLEQKDVSTLANVIIESYGLDK